MWKPGATLPEHSTEQTEDHAERKGETQPVRTENMIIDCFAGAGDADILGRRRANGICMIRRRKCSSSDDEHEGDVAQW